MEIGGERKRKADLDWNKLLDSDEPPPELLIKPMAEWEEEKLSNKYKYLRNLSDKELMKKVDRFGNHQSTAMQLPDGGEKLRLEFKYLQAEVDRRKSRKSDDKCKAATRNDDERIYAGSTGRLSKRIPSAPMLDFASSFMSKLGDDKRVHGKSDAFGEEILTINCCNQRKRGNLHFSFKTTDKRCLSSRKSAFKSSSHFAKRNDASPGLNYGQSRSQNRTPVSRHLVKDVSCSYEKDYATQLQPLKNSRKDNKNVVLVEEEEHENDAASQADKVDQSIKITKIFYPSRDNAEAIELDYSDIDRLAPRICLTSNIMDFYILYLQQPGSPTATRKSDFHFFNTFFYKKLKEDLLNQSNRKSSFVKFRRWWKGVNIFDKAYIFLPVHEHSHWSLIIICMPHKEAESGPIVLHLDSLGMHDSKSIFDCVKSFLTEEWKFLSERETVTELPMADKLMRTLSQRIHEKAVAVPQQTNEYDCGLFVLFFMERFIDEAPERLKEDLDKFGRRWFRPEEASSLRKKVKELLKEQFKIANRVIVDVDP